MVQRSRAALSHLKFRHIALIQYLLQEGTLRKAARRLSISQPAATAMLSDIESLLGVQLFTRSRQGVAPTAQTLALAPRLRILMNDFDELGAMLDRLDTGEHEVLRVGVVPQAFTVLLPRAIEGFRQAGGCHLHTVEGSAQDLLARLLAGELDCVLGRLPPDVAKLGRDIASLTFVNLYEDDVCVVCGPDHPAARLKKPGYARLAQCDWVLQRISSSVRQALTEAFLRQGLLLPHPVVETPTYTQALDIVAATRLLTAAPRHTAMAHARSGRVKVLDIALGVAPMQVCLILRKSAETHPQIVRFRSVFEAMPMRFPDA
ncbi:LysR family transcriptional regulator [Bordetella bronchiseptica]|uniref:LysR family transcriptional regulator n=1 Tax=Bordetella bronchiseptica TaxID=518 RepID=UPI00028B6CFD|nr:LysR family transcriptional regulator [Bordetella bronchiseptica]KCV32178.1 LysR substrate-binding domain protein [Bordetella bronchiseptica 00-P-2730]KAK71137.1 LysR substrate-binding domain protein [Bordetella bronchiseptica MO211]KCV50678.1 LysR substrate-binding domain protein [Bordetella bronchiseptica 7E71]KDC13279.1 LysR substrate-binding domain protein [Bordetella bronchiseptica E014]KDC17363.1 LysR substrate-binding domain protein [Bordetella bronchiseptica F-1]